VGLWHDCQCRSKYQVFHDPSSSQASLLCLCAGFNMKDVKDSKDATPASNADAAKDEAVRRK
jgi:hypothetical protein